MKPQPIIESANLDVPAEPSESAWPHVTPGQFEERVADYLRKLDHRLTTFQVTNLVAGPNGDFNMEAFATFSVPGHDMVIRVEGHHQQLPITRELVQALAEKLPGSGPHHALFCSTAPFEASAVQLARLQHIALVHLTDGSPIVIVRSVFPESYVAHDAYLVTLNKAGRPAYRADAFEEAEELLFGDEAPRPA